MSGTFAANEPVCNEATGNAIELLVEARPRDIGGFAVRRTLPSMRRRLVGPFLFFDHMGPADFPPGSGLDVRPHPHIELATVTYLFDGEIDHRDSIGSFQTIRPGDVNWMLAGRGVVHSERSSPGSRARGMRIHGIQSWVALPLEHELSEPRFEHHSATTVPQVVLPGVTLSVIAGDAYGARSPVGVLSPTIYVHAQMEAGAVLAVDDTHEERGVYVVEGAVGCEATSVQAGTMAVLRPGATVKLTAREASRVMIVGGARLAGDRYIDWNFVSSSKERIEQARRDWKERRFPKVPGDEIEYVPLPERRT
jgi:redox-sensitive bicupin YhaK (pirin superfamily)